MWKLLLGTTLMKLCWMSQRTSCSRYHFLFRRECDSSLFCLYGTNLMQGLSPDICTLVWPLSSTGAYVRQTCQTFAWHWQSCYCQDGWNDQWTSQGKGKLAYDTAIEKKRDFVRVVVSISALFFKYMFFLFWVINCNLRDLFFIKLSTFSIILSTTLGIHLFWSICVWEVLLWNVSDGLL